MKLTITIFSFLFGLVIGSFLNVVIGRAERKESIEGRSYCESCKKTLSAIELIPVLSFALQKGRCRSCGTALSWQYPLVELGTGILFTYVTLFTVSSSFQYTANSYTILTLPFWFYPFLTLPFWFYPLSLWLLIITVLSASIVIFVSDLRYRIIPNAAVLFLVFSGVGLRALDRLIIMEAKDMLWWDIGAALALALFFAGIWFVTQGRGIGLGDAKLVLGTSLVVGFPVSLAAVLISFWLGALAGIALVLARYKSLKDQIPFGPFILAGTAFAYFFSEKIFSFIGL
jgi:prepilin signal peptidase PulO-like enzyme (type II secretory pathway)